MPLILTWHPTYAYFHNPFEWGAFEADLERFGRLIKGTLEPQPNIITNPSGADILRIAECGIVAVDIETAPENYEETWTGKDPTRAKLKTIGLGNTQEGCSLTWPPSREQADALFKVLGDAAITKVFHNGAWFDLRVLKRFGVVVKNWEDTRDARRACSSTSSLSLRYITSLCTDAIPWKENEEDDAKGSVFTKNMEDLKRYNAFDCVYTARCWEAIKAEPEWKTERVKRIYGVHRELARIAAEMHDTGFLVDQWMRDWIGGVMYLAFQEKAEELKAIVNIEGFECQPNHMRGLIFKRHEKGNIKRFSLPDPIDPKMYSNPKNMQTIKVDFDALLQLLINPDTPKELRQIIQAYWDATSIQKSRSTFVVSDLVSHAIGLDGRLRPGWNSCGTDTGRFSCSEPNLMNIEQLLRGMYIAAPGHVLVHADYSQLELRVMAAVAQDHVLAGFLDTGDVYTADAKAWFSLPSGMTKCDCKRQCEKPTLHVKNSVRKQSKIIHLGAQYSAGTSTVYRQALAQDRTITFQAATLLHSKFKQTYHRTVAYWEEEMERVRATGYSESRILHRRRVYPREPEITAVANYPIQGTASDIANLAMIELDAKLKRYVRGAKLLVQLHDAFDVEAREKDERVVREIMQEVMEKPIAIEGKDYVFPVEIKVATRWDDV